MTCRWYTGVRECFVSGPAEEGGEGWLLTRSGAARRRLTVLGNLLADVALTVADPRIRLA